MAWGNVMLAGLVVAAADTATDPLSLLTGLGPAGIIIVLLVVGKLRTEGEVKRLEVELDRKDQVIEAKDAQLAALQDGIVGQAIPALTRYTDTVEQVMVVLRDRQERQDWQNRRDRLGEP